MADPDFSLRILRLYRLVARDALVAISLRRSGVSDLARSNARARAGLSAAAIPKVLRKLTCERIRRVKIAETTTP